MFIYMDRGVHGKVGSGKYNIQTTIRPSILEMVVNQVSKTHDNTSDDMQEGSET